MYVGESERAVREIFSKARQAAPCIIFFDEIDALIPTRDTAVSDSHVASRVLSQFLAELDGIEELKGILVLGATNRPDMIDPAMLRPGRFDRILEIPSPDCSGRKEILAVHLRNKPLAEEMDLDQLAAQTDGFSGADLAAVCHRAALEAVRRVVEAAQGQSVDEAPISITAEQLRSAMEQVRQSKVLAEGRDRIGETATSRTFHFRT